MQYSTLALAAAAMAGVAQAVDVQVVNVGWNPVNNATGLKFWPEKITAEPGSMVQFQFWAGNHTVTQSNFDNFCTPINEINSSIAGIDSEWQPVAASAESREIPTYTIMVNDSAPLWFYCKQGPHCQNGMSMVINENTAGNATRSLENYKALAAGEDVTVTPPTDGGSGGNAGGVPGAGNDAGNGAGNAEGTPVAGDGAASEESNVPAAASSFAIPSTMLLALGAAFMLL